jgi:hypothetical protein
MRARGQPRHVTDHQRWIAEIDGDCIVDDAVPARGVIAQQSSLSVEGAGGAINFLADIIK